MQIQDREQSHASIKVVGLTQTYATRLKSNVGQIPRSSLQPLISLDLGVGSCNSVLVSRLSEDSQELRISK